MTDYDLYDLIHDAMDRMRADLQALDLAAERYDQRLTRCLQLVQDARALLAECDG